MSILRVAAVAALLAVSSWAATAAPVTPNPSSWGNRSLVQPVATQACRRCKSRCDAMYNQECGQALACRKGYRLCMRQCWLDYCGSF